MPMTTPLLRAVVAVATAGAAAAMRADRAAAAAAGRFSPVPGKAVAAAAAAIGARTGTPPHLGGGSQVGPLWSKAGNRQGGFKNRKAPQAPPSTEVIGQKEIDLLHEAPMDLEKFERELQWGLESFEEAHYTLNEDPVPVKRKQDTPEHPPVEKLKPRPVPRPVHAQVVVVRQDEQGEYWVLLHRRAMNTIKGGKLDVMSGDRERWEEDSHVTAIREVVVESGLLDAEQLSGALEAFHELAEKKHVPTPLKFEIFHQTSNSDWWVLQIQGEGVFTPKLTTVKSGRIKPILRRLDREKWIKAPVPGHAWFRMDSVSKLPPGMLTRFLAHRIKDAHRYLMNSEDDEPKHVDDAWLSERT